MGRRGSGEGDGEERKIFYRTRTNSFVLLYGMRSLECDQPLVLACRYLQLSFLHSLSQEISWHRGYVAKVDKPAPLVLVSFPSLACNKVLGYG